MDQTLLQLLHKSREIWQIEYAICRNGLLDIISNEIKKQYEFLASENQDPHPIAEYQSLIVNLLNAKKYYEDPEIYQLLYAFLENNLEVEEMYYIFKEYLNIRKKLNSHSGTIFYFQSQYTIAKELYRRHFGTYLSSLLPFDKKLGEITLSDSLILNLNLQFNVNDFQREINSVFMELDYAPQFKESMSERAREQFNDVLFGENDVQIKNFVICLSSASARKYNLSNEIDFKFYKEEEYYDRDNNLDWQGDLYEEDENDGVGCIEYTYFGGCFAPSGFISKVSENLYIVVNENSNENDRIHFSIEYKSRLSRMELIDLLMQNELNNNQ